MKLGFSPMTAGILKADEAFRLASELGFDFVEIAWDMQEINSNLTPLREVKSLISNTGIEISIHLPFIDLNLASLMPGIKQNSIERLKVAIEYGAETNALVGVLHTGRVPWRGDILVKGGTEKLVENLSEIDTLIPVGLENLAIDNSDLLQGVQELEELTVKAGKKFGNTLDFGHAMVEGGRNGSGQEQIGAYHQGLSRLIHLHLHDNDGFGDQHRVLGRGKIDWSKERDFLRNFGGTICLEIVGNSEDVRESVRFLRELIK